MAATLARRTASLRFASRFAYRPSLSPPSISSHLPSNSRAQIAGFQRPIRRESLLLSSMLPIHNAIACARLVCKLPSDSNACIQGRFVNYLSPI